MRPEDYPPQEPLSDFARPYHEAVLKSAEEFSGTEVLHGTDPYQSLVFFPAAAPTGDVLIMIHGGGWTNGYKEWMTFMSRPLNAAGIAFVSLGYRLAPTHLFPTGLDDCMAGVAWVFHNVAEMAGNAGRIFLGGHSAGGHYASLMAVRRDWQHRFALPSDVIRGCAPVSGVYRFDAGSGLSMRPRFLGTEENEIPASPLHNIQSVPPPFLISFGSRDFPHLKIQAQEMADALGRAGGDVRMLELADRDHLGASLACGDADGQWATTVLGWLRGI